MAPLGMKAPSFKLPDTVNEKNISLDDLHSDVATVIMFICNHCPFVKHVQQELVRLARDAETGGFAEDRLGAVRFVPLIATADGRGHRTD